MSWNKYIWNLICTVAALTLLASCSDDDAPRDTVQMPVTLIIPAEALDTRTPGDPGTYEKFNNPQYLYLYVVFNGNQVTAIERPLTEGWTKTVLSEGGDSIYRYNGSIHVNLINNATYTSGNVYAAVSYTPLTLSNTNPTQESAVTNITFTLTDNNIRYLQDIYSSPYNLTETVNNNVQYYGAIKDLNSAVPHVDLILYHVAAKVDLIWNVADDVQTDIRLTGKLTVNGLSRTGYLFLPNENTTAGETYTHDISINVGNQWDGRAYFYGIPYSVGNRYPLTLSLEADGKTDKTVSLDIPYSASSSDPFTHWMRGNILINGWTQN